MAVVVGFIPTEVGFKALAAAREEAEQRGGPLVVVNVLRAGIEEDPRHADEQQLAFFGRAHAVASCSSRRRISGTTWVKKFRISSRVGQPEKMNSLTPAAL